VSPFQDGKLLAESQIFKKQFATRTARSHDHIKQELQRTEHETVVAERCCGNASAVGFAAMMVTANLDGTKRIMQHALRCAKESSAPASGE
jgi:hypothetical protein